MEEAKLRNLTMELINNMAEIKGRDKLKELENRINKIDAELKPLEDTYWMVGSFGV